MPMTQCWHATQTWKNVKCCKTTHNFQKISNKPKMLQNFIDISSAIPTKLSDSHQYAWGHVCAQALGKTISCKNKWPERYRITQTTLIDRIFMRLSFSRGEFSIGSSNINAMSLIRPFCVMLRNPVLGLCKMWTPRNLASSSSWSQSTPSENSMMTESTMLISFLAQKIRSSTQQIAMNFLPIK